MGLYISSVPAKLFIRDVWVLWVWVDHPWSTPGLVRYTGVSGGVRRSRIGTRGELQGNWWIFAPGHGGTAYQKLVGVKLS